jgi:hypothetical protein
MGAARPFRQAVKCGAGTIATEVYKLVSSGIVATLIVAAFAVGATGSAYYRPSARTAVAAALKAPELKNLGAYFPRQPGSRRCRVYGGGPPGGTITVLTCWTIVATHGDGSVTVSFRMAMPYTKKDIGETWTYRVSRALHVTLERKPRQEPGGAA